MKMIKKLFCTVVISLSLVSTVEAGTRCVTIGNVVRCDTTGGQTVRCYTVGNVTICR